MEGKSEDWIEILLTISTELSKLMYSDNNLEFRRIYFFQSKRVLNDFM